jgi:glutamyl-Q tRNA(Asp) synthetase
VQQNPDSGNGVYPGTCRHRARRTRLLDSLKVPDETIEFDEIQGATHSASRRWRLRRLRRDGIIAYQLAVVVDDAAQQSRTWSVVPICSTTRRGSCCS